MLLKQLKQYHLKFQTKKTMNNVQQNLDVSNQENTLSESLLKHGERLDDLEFNDMHIISHKDRYCFTSDSVMLANLVKAGSRDTVVDLCTGGGIIALLIAGKTNAKKIYGVEIQDDMSDMAMRSVKLNNLCERVSIINHDVIGISKVLGHGSADIIVCNPPYFKTGEGSQRLNPCIAIARHEILLPLEEMIKSVSELLKFGGTFYMVHKSERLAEAITLLSKYLLEPKVLYNITTGASDIADTFIIVCKKCGKTGLIVHNINHI